MHARTGVHVSGVQLYIAFDVFRLTWCSQTNGAIQLNVTYSTPVPSSPHVSWLCLWRLLSCVTSRASGRWATSPWRIPRENVERAPSGRFWNSSARRSSLSRTNRKEKRHRSTRPGLARRWVRRGAERELVGARDERYIPRARASAVGLISYVVFCSTSTMRV